MILDLDIGNTLSKWRLKDADSSEIRSRGAVWTREEWRPGADIPDLDVVEAVRISSVARRAVLERSEEHTSELQSRPHLVCRLLLEKKKKNNKKRTKMKHNKS